MKAFRILIFVLVLGCHSRVEKPVTPDELHAKSDAASQLYFKNVRSIYYYIEQPDEETISYTMKSLIGNPLSFSIIQNWKTDEVSVQLMHDEKSENLVLADSIRLSGMKEETKALLIYNAILSQVKISYEGDTAQAFERVNLLNFQKSYFDYLRLVNVR